MAFYRHWEMTERRRRPMMCVVLRCYDVTAAACPPPCPSLRSHSHHFHLNQHASLLLWSSSSSNKLRDKWLIVCQHHWRTAQCNTPFGSSVYWDTDEPCAMPKHMRCLSNMRWLHVSFRYGYFHCVCIIVSGRRKHTCVTCVYIYANAGYVPEVANILGVSR